MAKARATEATAGTLAADTLPGAPSLPDHRPSPQSKPPTKAQIDQNGRWTFDEVASYTRDGANTWAVQQFKTVRQGNQVTYFFMSSDIQRGIDVFSWTGPAGPALGTVSASRSPAPVGNIALGAMAGVLLSPPAGGRGPPARPK